MIHFDLSIVVVLRSLISFVGCFFSVDIVLKFFSCRFDVYFLQLCEMFLS